MVKACRHPQSQTLRSTLTRESTVRIDRRAQCRTRDMVRRTSPSRTRRAPHCAETRSLLAISSNQVSSPRTWAAQAPKCRYEALTMWWPARETYSNSWNTASVPCSRARAREYRVRDARQAPGYNMPIEILSSSRSIDFRPTVIIFQIRGRVTFSRHQMKGPIGVTVRCSTTILILTQIEVNCL